MTRLVPIKEWCDCCRLHRRHPRYHGMIWHWSRKLVGGELQLPKRKVKR